MLKTLALAVSATLLFACAPISKTHQVSYIELTTGMKFVYVKGGSFTMGDPTSARQESTPAHKVTLSGFHVGIYEVTFDQYDFFCKMTNREKPNDQNWGRGNRPVINVSWDEANAMADWLTQQTGLPFSLPSEAQWEYFARANTSSDFWTGSNLPPNYAVCLDCGSQWDGLTTAPVGSFPPNGLGLYDTAGNVGEWVLDDPHDNYQNAPGDGSAWFNADSQEKNYRGGAYSYYARDLMSHLRDWTRRDAKKKDLGFRLVINDPSPVPAAKN